MAGRQMTKIRVQVMPREVILDTQGRAVEQTLALNHLPVWSCRVGKMIELEIEAEPTEALKQAERIAQLVLHNPLIENYKLEVVPK